MRSSQANTTTTSVVSTMDGQPKDAAAPTETTSSAADLTNPFPLICSVPINGRITNLVPLTLHHSKKSLVFFLTDRHQYGVLGYNSEETGQQAIETHASGNITAASLWSGAGHLSAGDSSVGGSSTAAGGGGWTNDNTLAVLGREAEAGPMVLVDPHYRCIVLHLHTGLLAVLPINRAYNPTTSLSQGHLKDDLALSTPPRRTSASPSCLGSLYHCRIEERTVLSMAFLQFATTSEVLPHLCVLHQDARGVQHVTTHVLHLQKRQLYFSQSTALASATTEWLRKTAVDGGSAMLLSVPPLTAPAEAVAAATNVATSSTTPANNQSSSSNSSNNASGGVIIVGQRQITYCSWTTTKIIPVPQALYLASTELPADPSGMPRFLLSDEFGNLHLLTLLLTTASPKVVLGLSLETLGSCNLARDVCYLGQGLVYVASHLGDSQLVQIHDEPIPVEGAASSASGRGEGPDNSATDLDADMELQLADTTYIQVLEEYTNLGPILDFDLIPTAPPTSVSGTATTQHIHQSQVVTCSGSSKMGSLRLVRNGIGMNEYASVDIPGISNMWPLRQKFDDINDSYLVQSFVGETRVLGATMVSVEDETMEGNDEDSSEEPYGSLEEVVLPGFESSTSTLFVCNLKGDRFIQITETEVRLIGPLGEGGIALDTWTNGPITVATANESGQIAVAQRGGSVTYLKVVGEEIKRIAEKEMEQEVSCLNLNPFQTATSDDDMEVDVTEQRALSSSKWLAVGLWEDFTVRLLNLQSSDCLEQCQKVHLNSQDEGEEETEDSQAPGRRNRNTMMARSLCLITLDFSSGGNSSNGATAHSTGVDMLFVGLGDGSLISFAVLEQDGYVSVRCKKEVCLGTLRIDLVPLSTRGGGSCVLATGDRPTVIYLAGIGGGSTSSAHFNPKLCYSSVNLSASEDETDDNIEKPPSHQSIAVNVACPFFSPLLFDTASTAGQSPTSSQQYSLCVADESCLRLGVIDDIQKLHVTTCRLGMAPRRIVHCVDGRLFAVGCMESGIKHLGAFEANNSMGNCIRFMDDTSFDDIQRFDMDPFETILSMAYVTLAVPDRDVVAEQTPMQQEERPNCKPFLVVGTGYSMADEAEMTRGRILLYSCEADETSASNTRTVRQVTELSTNGGVLSICQFFNGSILCSVNSKTHVCELKDDAGLTKLKFAGVGHHGHILSMFVKSRARPQLPDGGIGQSETSIDAAKSVESKEEKKSKEELLAIVGDLMRSVSVVQYFPEHQILEEIARDFNANWTTAVEMLTDDIYLAGEHWSNLYCLRRNRTASSEEVRCRLDIIGEYHLGEMCNKFMSGSLVMPVSASGGNGASNRRYQATRTASPKKGESSSNGTITRLRRPVVVTGSQTLFGSVDGSLGVVLGLDGRTAAFFTTMERAMAKKLRPIGDLSHQLFRAFQAERRMHPAHGFVDGDLIESFLDLDRNAMDAVVKEMNQDGGWEVDDAVAFPSKRPDTMEEESPELSVDDVVAMVEEISMLH